MELRHHTDVNSAASLATLKMLPMQVEHRAVINAENAAKYKCGHFGEDVQVDGEFVELSYVVDTKDGVKAVEVDGKEWFSCGYVCDLVEEPGVYEGQAYTHRQTNIRYNHVALTSNPRLGTELRLDSLPFAFREDGANPPKEQMMRKVKVDSGLEYDASEEVAVYVGSLQKQLADEKENFFKMKKAMEEEKEESKKAKEKSDGERDQYKADAEKAKKELKELQDSIPEKVKKMAKDRADLVAVATDILDEDTVAKMDSMTDADIRKAVILSQDSALTEDSLKGKSEDYLQARFDAITEKVKKDGGANLAAAREATTVKTGADSKGVKGKTNVDSDDPREKMRQDRKDAWKPKDQK